MTKYIRYKYMRYEQKVIDIMHSISIIKVLLLTNREGKSGVDIGFDIEYVQPREGSYGRGHEKLGERHCELQCSQMIRRITDKGGTVMTCKVVRGPYSKPQLEKQENLKEITFECPQWQCSVNVPPPPPGP